MSWYNENDRFASRWLRELSQAGHIAWGYVDDRSIREIQAEFIPSQAHFFAGIGGWSYALRLAGVPDDFPVWTGSCPCQPFSAAGKRGGFDDDRHLWPVWFNLIRECRPPVIFGEQVASPDGLRWLDSVFSDLEDEGYACGAADLCAAGFGALHIRQRLYFVAQSRRIPAGRTAEPGEARGGRASGKPSGPSVAGGLDHASSARLRGDGRAVSRAQAQGSGPRFADGGVADLALASGNPGPLDNPGVEGPQRLSGPLTRAVEGSSAGGTSANPWASLEWLPCSDGKARPTQPGLLPLAHGVPQRVGRLRGYGNAIVPQVAAAFVRAAIGEA